MHWFQQKDGALHADDVPLTTIAEQYGTPTFVYSQTTLEHHIDTIDGAFSAMDHLTCYSVKANSTGAVLRVLAARGMGADIVSGGELFRALKAGIPAEKIVFSGVGKTDEEIKYALESGILMFNIESESELYAIDRVAGTMGKKAPISFRVNPNVNPKTHKYMATGLKKSKFGVPQNFALALYVKAAALDNIDVIGIDAHIGSQLTDVSPYREAVEKLKELVDAIKAKGIELSLIDIGGGLGINYKEKFPPDPKEWAEMVVPVLKDTGCKLLLEPGRSIVGNAGVMITKVIYIKRNEEKTFIIVDGAMNDLMRPTLYDSHHTIVPVVDRNTGVETVDIVGPICESGDFLAHDREISMPEEGDILAVLSAGAYGRSMSSNYNSRPRGAEVMVNGKEVTLIAERESFEDLIAKEK